MRQVSSYAKDKLGSFEKAMRSCSLSQSDIDDKHRFLTVLSEHS